MHSQLPLEQLIALCDRAVRQRWQQSGLPMAQRHPDQIRAKPFEGKLDRYEDSGWNRVGKLRDAIVRKHLVVWWNEKTDEIRCLEPPTWA